MVYQRLMEIESRLLPMGLHTVGVPPTAEEAIATLVSIAEIDRPEDEILGLPRILANAEGRKLEKITQGTRAAVRALVDESTDSQGRVKEVQNVMEKALGGMFGQAPYRKALASAGFQKASEDKMLEPLFEYLEFCLRQVVADNELGALVDALDGQYIEPGPGGDPIRNPGVLPTGKNMHALDPQSIPTTAAVECANRVVEKLLERLEKDNGELPE